jgi:hypothetical protein
MRGRGLPVVLVDGGDCFFGVPSTKTPTPQEESHAFGTARKILQAYNYMGYDALGLGPADLQFGIDKLKSFLAGAKFPVVCANLVDKAGGKTVFPPSVVVNAGRVRVGVFGVVLSTLNPSYKARITGESYELLDAVEVTRKIVPELRSQCDILVALSHINIDDNERIAVEVPGIDVIVDPYSRRGTQPVWITEGEYVAWLKKVPLLRIDGQGSRVGVCEITFPPVGKPEDDFFVYDYPLEPQIFDHPEVDKIAKGTYVEPEASRDPKKVNLFAELFLGEETCGSCHQAQHEFWKATKHATAYDTLTKSKEHLKPDCVECHTVAYGVAYASPSTVGEFKGVQCESCHGINHRHAEEPPRYRLGQVKDTRCWGCHNPEILEKPFEIDKVKGRVSCPKMEN